jgi:outer membrane protein TolC
MKRKFITLSLVLSALASQTQPLTLETCRQKAVLNYPSYRQHELIDNSAELRINNLNKVWLPSMNLSGQASYQSDVTKVPTIIPQFSPEPIDKDWYKFYLDMVQVIYDGGSTRQSREIEEVSRQIDQQNLEMELYSLRQRVDNVYFTILLLQENARLLEVTVTEIEARIKDVESSVRNGIVLPINSDILNAELMRVRQKQSELSIGITSAFSVLSVLTGEEIPETMPLQLPEPEVVLPADGSSRLEYGLFGLQQKKLEDLKKLSGTQLVPRLSAFAQAGLGRPAFDMLSNDLEGYYIVGARLSWNFWNWNKTRNEKKILDLNKEIMVTKEETFTQNLATEMINRQAEIIRFETLIEKDAEILSLRQNIVRSYASQLENGVITATEYLAELNAETHARMNLQIHKVMLVQSKYLYLASTGKI